MRVILQVQTGPSAGHKTVLRIGQSLHVGRHSLNDLCFAGDTQMAGTHFEIVVDGRACYLVDAGSSQGTQRNGELVRRAVLHDGDVVTAGNTSFLVHVEGADNAVDEVPGRLATGAPANLKSEPAGAEMITFTVDTTSSGIIRCCGSTGEVQPVRIAEMLLSNSPLFLTVNFRQLGQPLPESIANPGFLFDWIAEEARASNSPVLFPANETEGWQQIVTDAWSNDVMLMIFSRSDRDALLNYLIRMLRDGDAREHDGMLGFCWPSVLASLLTMGNLTDFGQKIISAVDAILIEDPHDSKNWQLYGGDDLPARLCSLGWQETQPTA